MSRIVVLIELPSEIFEFNIYILSKHNCNIDFVSAKKIGNFYYMIYIVT